MSRVKALAVAGLLDRHGPFGGSKQSGLGRELGREGLEAFQETKHVHIETEIAPKEWWYPYGEGSGEERSYGA